MQETKIQFLGHLWNMLDLFHGTSVEQDKLVLIFSSDYCGLPAAGPFFCPDQITALDCPNITLRKFEVQQRR